MHDFIVSYFSRNLNTAIVYCVPATICQEEEEEEEEEEKGEEFRHTSLLYLTQDHLYIWDKLTDSLVKLLPLRDCSFSISSSTRQQITLGIATPPNTGQGDVPKDSGGEVVRRYLSLSVADMQEDLSASSAPVSGDMGDMGDRCASHDHVGGGEGVVMCLDTLLGTQLLAMCHSLIQ